MTTQLDLAPAAQRLVALAQAVPDDALGLPTPCSEYTVGDLLDHVAGFLVAFQGAAVKQPIDGSASGHAENLPPDWRERLASDADALVAAWAAPEAWEGMTAAGGVDLPGEVAGVVALDELVLHGWDLAKALGQPAGYDGPGLQAVHDAVQQFRVMGLDVFGPEVKVPDDASLLDRTLGLAGRDPRVEPARLEVRR